VDLKSAIDLRDQIVLKEGIITYATHEEVARVGQVPAQA
jgi:hypothetical protein